MKKVILGIFALIIAIGAGTYSYITLQKKDTILAETNTLNEKYSILKTKKDSLEKAKEAAKDSLKDIETEIDKLSKKLNK